ncbi:MAG TPA: cytochrome c peroxidase [Pyrinomonadaceae bacterium]|nr:cytochrome c peroxidase [Pyrinomonadaceae bacterium]
MLRIKLFAVALFALFGSLYFGYGGWESMAKTAPTGNTIPTPTGVQGSVGDYANKVGIYWDTMKGATLYRVFRSTTNDPSTATDVGTSVSNYFWDTSAIPQQQYFYWVRAENAGSVSGMSAAVQGLRAQAGASPHPFYSPLEPPAAPAGNPVTASKAALGKALFWDEQLSSTKTVACGTCHRPAEGGSDPRSGTLLSLNPGPDGAPQTADDIFGSPGVPKNNLDGTYTEATFYGFRLQVTGRKAPTYLNAGYATGGLFWDGRALDTFRDPVTNEVLLAEGASLESQVLGPPVNDVEMAHGGRNWPQIAERMAASRPLALASNVPQSLSNWIDGRDYPELFQEAFGTPEVTPARIAMAIATHERQLFSDRTPFDKWAVGIGGNFTMMEEMGAMQFIGSQCAQCHDGPLFADHLFHNIGVRPQADDLGRGIVTGNPDDNGKFKTTVLRNVELHAPFMHNGRHQTLEDVVAFYNRGGDFDAPNIDRGVIRPMGLTPGEQQSLVAFMKRPMTDPRVRDELPPFDRPQLYTESARVPQISGTGRAGSGAIVPEAIALEPPLLGNPSFTVGVARGAAGANAVVVIDSADPGVGASIPASGSFLRQSTVLTGTGYGSVNMAIPNNAALLGQTFYGRWYVPDPGAANGFSVSRLFSFTIFGEAATPAGVTHVDFDGDRKTDISIFRTALGEWWYQRSSDSQTAAFHFGVPSDKLVPADYTGDGKTDVAVWRPSSGEWYILRSEDFNFYSFPFGTEGDIPAPGDFDGDGRADAAVFRPSTGTWYIAKSSGGVHIETFGTAGDIPQAADYDGDGRADIAIFRPNGPSGAEWWVQGSTSGLFAAQFGLPTDKPLAADYTGDGKADIAFWRPSTGFWYVLRSEDFLFYAAPFGGPGDIPAPGDYDGDGKTDFAVYRPAEGTWYIYNSSGGVSILGFGMAGDYPVPGAYVP